MTKNNNNFYFILVIILLASISRIIPHYPNFTPLCAIALFGGKYFKNKYLAFIIPTLALWFSDLIINNFIINQYFESFIFFYSGFYWQYGSLLLIVFLGRKTLKKIYLLKLIGVSISSSLIFFIISNFGVWASSSLYSNDFMGLISCYIAAIPFYFGTISGTLFYSFFLFGSYELLFKNSLKFKKNFNQ